MGNRLQTERFIAKRLSAGGNDRRNRLIVRVAAASVALCTAVMLLSVFIVRGFQETISDKITGLAAHLEIVDFSDRFTLEPASVPKNLPYLGEIEAREEVRNLYPYAVKTGMLRTEEDSYGIILRGVDGAYDPAFFEEYLVRGRLPDFSAEEKPKEIVLSERVAARLKLDTGSRVEMLFPEEPPRRDRFVVSGIFNSYFPEFDKTIALTDLRNVQRLNGWDEDEASGIGIVLRDLSELDRAYDGISETVDANIGEYTSEVVVDIRERYGDVFDWIALLSTNETVILTIMIVVSAFNMITMMLILILQKTSFIGVLKTLGMRDGQIRRIFLFRIVRIILRGLFWGTLAALLLAAVQAWTGWLTLDAEGYFLHEVPVEVRWKDVLLADGLTFVCLTLLQLLPTRLVSRLSPYKSLKYEQGRK